MACLERRLNLLVSALLSVSLLTVPSGVLAQEDPAVEISHGGYAATAGALAFSLGLGAASGLAKAIYQPPLDADCSREPERCRRTPLQHVLVGGIFVAAAGGTFLAGYGAGKFAEHREWNPKLGWSLAGGYLGVPTMILLQNVIPRWSPDWTREVLGIALTAGGSVGAAYAFGELAEHQGHAWPAFGFGAGGMAAGLAIGTALFPDTFWVPFFGGLGAVVGASAAAVAVSL